MFKAPLLGILAALSLGPAAQAAPVLLDSYLHSYGTNPGRIDPAGSDTLGGDFVQISDSSSTRFSDVFDLSGLVYDTITIRILGNLLTNFIKFLHRPIRLR